MAYRSARMRCVILGAGLLIGTAGVAGPVWAADDGYQNVFSSVFTAVGLMPPDKSPEIDYRERAPLVVPPKQTLATPQTPGANRTAAWPKDPDVIARQQEEDDAKAPMTGLFDKRVDRPDSKTEMLKHRAAETDDPTPTSCRASEHSDAHCRLGPDEMRRQDAVYRAMNLAASSTNVVTAGVEPEREYLTQPPKGYMKPTKTVRVTAEAPEKKIDESNPLSELLPHFKNDEDSPNN